MGVESIRTVEVRVFLRFRGPDKGYIAGLEIESEIDGAGLLIERVLASNVEELVMIEPVIAGELPVGELLV